ncbi:hypothetical protein [Moraxella porci]|uniref:hypothetical protein n=1 Tax=Moraxella porci TaxID=1288392 RepID=UPI00244B1D7C|nr:hypothetical protein [Moraxella porci]MDH2274110.1 hypothetical protein [Moraxella porci]
MANKEKDDYLTTAAKTYFGTYAVFGIVFGLLALVVLIQAASSISYSAGLDDALTLATLFFIFLAFIKRFPKPARIIFGVAAIVCAFLVGKI